jgi:hypothetical protein
MLEEPDCIVDNNLAIQFENWMSIAAINHANRDVAFENLAKAYNVLQAITGTTSKANIGNDTYIYYATEIDYLEDVSNWIGWYDENKCSVTMKDVLIKMQEQPVTFLDYSQEKQVEYLHLRYPTLSTKDAVTKDSLERIAFSRGLPDFIRRTN